MTTESTICSQAERDPIVSGWMAYITSHSTRLGEMFQLARQDEHVRRSQFEAE